MPELRQNIATRDWVIIATERAKRPESFVQQNKERVEDRPVYEAGCPFCPGNEEIELERLRLPSSGPWRTRVVANRFPALREDGPRERQFKGVNRSITGVGYHEVVVETPRHNSCPALETVDDIASTLQAFLARGQAMAADPRVEHVVYFKNHGRRAGASLLHPHAQIIAMPVVPYNVRVRTEEARRNFDDHGECVFCRMRMEEQRQQERLVLESDHFTAFVPYAAYSPFHTWVLPRRHAANFLDITPGELRDMAQVLHTLLRKIYVGLNDPDFNYIVRSGPERERTSPSTHWYLTIVPHVSHAAGFELGTGMFINSALPEESAAFLRAVTTD